MKKYQVFKHPDNRLEAVKTGFSFPGLIFGFFWLFWHKMWMWGGIAAFVSLIAYFILPSPAGYIYGVPYGHSFGLADLINIVIQVIIGVLGNELRSSSLRERGFDLVKIVKAATPDDAKAKYLREPGDPDEFTPSFML